MPRKAPFSEADARVAIASSICWADALRRLGYAVKGANYRTLQKWANRWGIDTAHFDPHMRCVAGQAHTMQIPLDEVLVENSTYNRFNAEAPPAAAGLLEPRCELCGQGELWHRRRMSLVLDHINGISNDNRIENLRIVCPNCAATLDTHCGREPSAADRVCPGCA